MSLLVGFREEVEVSLVRRMRRAHVGADDVDADSGVLRRDDWARDARRGHMTICEPPSRSMVKPAARNTRR